MRVGFGLFCILSAGVALGEPPGANAEPLCNAPPPVVWSYLPEGCQKERIRVSGELSFNIIRKASTLAEQAWQREVLARYGERFRHIDFAACKTVSCGKGAVSGTERCAISAYPCASDMDEGQRAMVEKLTSLDTPNMPEVIRGGEAVASPSKAPSEETSKAPSEEKREIKEETRGVSEAVKSEEEGKEEPKKEEERREEARTEEKREEPLATRELNLKEVREMQRLLNRAGYHVRADGIFGDESRDALSDWERRAGLPDEGYPTFPMLERLRRDVK